ncbi:hypothetical protein [Oscillibacter sp. 1-3]|uniref:hypothetical protein n=1 Tax=Oscillibacter sp. 1-3 TaxID=1235797 RepID=UPI00033658B5|nr:hypothetical protein [Oscillibacter sp. 1-3]EOS63479.1 hypothetical protein C816_03252 [Oscillibacter sp. 1-3]
MSYPDVTLLEPLAEVFGLGVEELIACRRAEEKKKEEQPVKNILEISRENQQTDRRRTALRTALAVLAIVAAVLAAIFYAATTIHEQMGTSIVL